MLSVPISFQYGQSLDAFPVDRFVGDAIRVDCRDLDARQPIPPERVPDVNADYVVFHTGWDRHWDTERYLDHPFLGPETATQCAFRGYDVGLDTLSPDPSPSPNSIPDEPDGYQAHHTLLDNECLIVENLTELERLPRRFELRIHPLPLESDGASVRAVGVPRKG